MNSNSNYLKESVHYRTTFSEKWERKNILDDVQGVLTACHALSTPHLTASPQCWERVFILLILDMGTQGHTESMQGSQMICHPLI